jgi:SAM-dependent methyltransferase
MSSSLPKPHSAEYLNDLRDYWWNADFLALMGERLDFKDISTVLDVGAGVGHWGRALAPHLPAHATLIGIDREPQWVEEAARRAQKAGLPFRYQLGDVLHLDFPDNSFDLVTCQTVLMHLPDPLQGLREMLRVAKPGGLILASEPNNLASIAAFTSESIRWSNDDLIESLRFHLICQRGKEALGLGFNNLGDLIPGMIASLGATDIRVYMPDRAQPMFPPYDRPEQKVLIALLRDWAKRGFYAWDEPETRRYFLAGGGAEADFEPGWLLQKRHLDETIAAIDAGTYHAAGGWLGLLTSARKSSGASRRA